MLSTCLRIHAQCKYSAIGIDCLNLLGYITCFERDLCLNLNHAFELLYKRNKENEKENESESENESENGMRKNSNSFLDHY
jgi:hypothetical protein